MPTFPPRWWTKTIIFHATLRLRIFSKLFYMSNKKPSVAVFIEYLEGNTRENFFLNMYTRNNLSSLCPLITSMRAEISGNTWNRFHGTLCRYTIHFIWWLSVRGTQSSGRVFRLFNTGRFVLIERLFPAVFNWMHKTLVPNNTTFAYGNRSLLEEPHSPRNLGTRRSLAVGRQSTSECTMASNCGNDPEWRVLPSAP